MKKNSLQHNLHSFARNSLNDQLEIMDEILEPDGHLQSLPQSFEQALNSKNKQTALIIPDYCQSWKSWRDARGQLRSVKDNTDALKSVTDSLEFLGKQVEDVTKEVDKLQIRAELWRKKMQHFVRNTTISKPIWEGGTSRSQGFPSKSGKMPYKSVKKIAGQINRENLKKWKKIIELTSKSNVSEEEVDHLTMAQAELNKIHEGKAKCAFVRSRRRWLEQGEECTKYFF